MNALETAKNALWASQSILIDMIALISASENKMHNFRPFSAAAGSYKGDFRTFLDYEITKALQDLWRIFPKTTHYRSDLGKIWRNPKFRDWKQRWKHFENATITSHFGFVFEENSDREIAWLSWHHPSWKALFSKCFPSTLKHKPAFSNFSNLKSILEKD